MFSFNSILIPFFANQLPFPLSFQFLDRDLSLHGRFTIWQFFHVDQLYRDTRPRVTRTASLVVHGDALFGVDRPTRIVGSVRALYDVTVTAHLTCVVGVVFGAPRPSRQRTFG